MIERFEKEKVEVSIIIPVYNSGKYLIKCLDSILKQEGCSIEIIIINDGSTDNSCEIIEEFKDLDSRIISLYKDNGGLSSARNAGIKLATGEYILHVDSDDWIEKDYCLDSYSFAKKNGLDIVITDMYTDYSDGDSKYTFGVKNNKKQIMDNLEVLDLWCDNNLISNCCNKLIKRELYLNNKIIHPEDITLGEDLVTTIRLIAKSSKIGSLKKPYYHYVQYTSSIMNNNGAARVYELERVFNIINNYLIENGINKNTDFISIINYTYILSISNVIDDPYYYNIISSYIALFKKTKIPFNIKNIPYFIYKLIIRYNDNFKLVFKLNRLLISSVKYLKSKKQ
ncbi:glycosyltransferase family 2 protein [Photobacterium damselae subsp. damselae]|uniref:glycosyltransferase family 2 protein n=1 Tax=Photobacterium damselae TaxID=38293 RepID=UPI0010FD573E|nr:glycosyltransferase family 2 protein [Photobacterium damselae]TLS80843.1 glycosyltransferase family 2 protein [Photobacterium damselae subsp. damselae]TLS87216.1 glycosyltransferase family 2 protein [Photobacterium damselae subsp. damselae]